MKLALKFWRLDIRNKNSAISAGFMMTSLQLLAGVSGPALDVFYQNSKLSRFEIVANKALSQTISHLFKCIFYISLVSINNHFPSWLLGLAAILAIMGTRMGTTILANWNETSFTRYTNKLVTGVSFICIVQGAYLLVVWIRPLLPKDLNPRDFMSSINDPRNWKLNKNCERGQTQPYIDC